MSEQNIHAVAPADADGGDIYTQLEIFENSLDVELQDLQNILKDDSSSGSQSQQEFDDDGDDDHSEDGAVLDQQRGVLDDDRVVEGIMSPMPMNHRVSIHSGTNNNENENRPSSLQMGVASSNQSKVGGGTEKKTHLRKLDSTSNENQVAAQSHRNSQSQAPPTVVDQQQHMLRDRGRRRQQSQVAEHQRIDVAVTKVNNNAIVQDVEKVIGAQQQHHHNTISVPGEGRGRDSRRRNARHKRQQHQQKPQHYDNGDNLEHYLINGGNDKLLEEPVLNTSLGLAAKNIQQQQQQQKKTPNSAPSRSRRNSRDKAENMDSTSTSLTATTDNKQQERMPPGQGRGRRARGRRAKEKQQQNANDNQRSSMAGNSRCANPAPKTNNTSVNQIVTEEQIRQFHIKHIKMRNASRRR